MKIGIIVAMEKEFRQLEALLENRKVVRINRKDCVQGEMADKTILLMHSGIGKVNAAIGTAEMIRNFHPDLVLSTGCAGGADVTLNVGDVVISSSCQYHDVYCGPENLAGQIQGMPSDFPSPAEIVEKAAACGVVGKIATGDWFVDTPEKMAEIHKTVPDAKAVDMESAAIAHTCFLYGVRFLSFRVISDIPLKEGNAVQYADFWSTMADKSFQAVRRLLLVALTCLAFFLNTATVSAADTLDVAQQMQSVEVLKTAGKTEEALKLCDSINTNMHEAFMHRYDREVIPVRQEYNAHEMKLEADHEFNELLMRGGVFAIVLCVVGIGLFFYIRRKNKTVAKSELEMRAAVSRAELAEKSKSMFLSNMTHEIRTPLNAIAGFSDVLTYPDLDAEMRKESADIIEMNSNLLQNLINDVVDTACMDLREMKFRIVACDVVKLSRNVTEMITKIKKTDAEMFFETDVERLAIMVDPLRLQQVLVNVLVNATKFCKQGSITLSVNNMPEEKMVKVSVTDTGIGIPKDKQAGVFKRFERVRENAEGFGLGLSICQFIIERFGGKIWVDPDYSDGARFIFTLPYGEQEQEGGMTL